MVSVSEENDRCEKRMHGRLLGNLPVYFLSGRGSLKKGCLAEMVPCWGRGEERTLYPLPGWFSLFQKGLEALHGIVRLHQTIQVDLLDGFKPLVHIIIETRERGLFRHF